MNTKWLHGSKENVILFFSVSHLQAESRLKTKAGIAIIGGDADAKRRSKSIRRVKIFNDLTVEIELKKDGFAMSRSRTYLHLLPENCSTILGWIHVTTVPVKCSLAHTEYERSDISTQFAVTSIFYLETLDSSLDPYKCFVFLSQDDRTSVLLGITAADKHSPILIHTE